MEWTLRRLKLFVLSIVLLAFTAGLQAQVITSYPGDLNSTGVVDQYDILPVGLRFGTNGPAADTALPVVFAPVIKDAWGDSIFADLNLGYVDGYGDGLIDLVDAAYVDTFWQQTHPDATFSLTYSPLVSTGIPVFIDTVVYLDDTAGNLQIEFVIAAGSAAQPAGDLYGIAFDLIFDTALVADFSSAVQVDYSSNTMAGTDELSIARWDSTDQVVSMALSRFDGVAPGIPVVTIASMTFVMEGNLAGGTIDINDVLDIRLENIIALSPNELLLPIFMDVSAISLAPFVSSVPPDPNSSSFRFYPNPAKDFLRLVNGGLLDAAPEVYGITGRRHELVSIRDGNDLLLDVRSLSTGTYLVRLRGGGTTLTGRFVKTIP